MPRLRKCICGCGLKTGSLIILYAFLVEEVFTFFTLVFVPSEQSQQSLLFRNESKSVRIFHSWTVFFNIIVICTGLYGINKQRAPLMIPYLAYRIVNLIFMTFTLINSREIANTLNAEIRKWTPEDEKALDTMPLVILAILVFMAVDFYCFLIVYSYYHQLLQNMTMVAVAVPIVSYIPHNAENFAYYVQPPSNPYIVQPKYPYQYDESMHAPPGYPYPPNINMNERNTSLPPPYRA